LNDARQIPQRPTALAMATKSQAQHCCNDDHQYKVNGKTGILTPVDLKPLQFFLQFFVQKLDMLITLLGQHAFQIL